MRAHEYKFHMSGVTKAYVINNRIVIEINDNNLKYLKECKDDIHNKIIEWEIGYCGEQVIRKPEDIKSWESIEKDTI